MVPKQLLAGLLALALTVTAASQEVFAPFVSQVEAEIRNNLIRLSWKDALDVRGAVYIYRSDTPFSARASLPVPVEVPYGACSYLDEADAPGTLHYFVAASDEYGRKYTLPLFNTNTVHIVVEPENVIGWADGEKRAPAPLSPNIPAPGIAGITVHIEGERVILSFTGEDSAKNLVLYRSLHPIRSKEDLLSALIIRRRAVSPIVDYPLPGINYHYALLYEEDLGSGIVSIRPGYNTTGAVRVAGGGTVRFRDMPLPGLRLSGEMFPGGFESGEAAAPLLDRAGKQAKQTTEILPEDRGTGGAGETYQLRSIAQGYFTMKEWDKAAEELRLFLLLPRTASAAARARFYLGQVYYFQGKPREALLEFLTARELVSPNGDSWIAAVLGVFAGR